MNIGQMLNNTLAVGKTFLHNLIGIGVAVSTLFAVTLPDTTPFETAEYQAVRFNNQLLLNVEIPKQSKYAAEIVLYSGTGFIGTLPIPSGGQRVVEASFPLPPSAVGKQALTITAYWRIHSWNDVIYPQEIYHRVEVTIPGG